MTDRHDEERALDEWSRRLTQALQILDLEVDHETLLELADRSSRSVTPSAGPISTFAVGYTAGLSVSRGKKGSNAAVKSAADVVFELCGDENGTRPDRHGWTDTGQ